MFCLSLNNQGGYTAPPILNIISIPKPIPHFAWPAFPQLSSPPSKTPDMSVRHIYLLLIMQHNTMISRECNESAEFISWRFPISLENTSHCLYFENLHLESILWPCILAPLREWYCPPLEDYAPNLRPLNFSLFQNSHIINTVGYEECLPENSYYSKVSMRAWSRRPWKRRHCGRA